MEKENKTHKKIEDLRDYLFDQMERLNDPTVDFEKELKKANAFIGIGNVIVGSAKAENDFMRMTKTKGTGFIPETSKQLGNGE